MEKIVLTTAVQTDEGATQFAVWMFSARRKHPDSPAEIRIIFREIDELGAFVINGLEHTCLYSDDETSTIADDLIKQLNKVNLATKSLNTRLVERCQADGKIGPGVISGVPD